jgi:hypothetical protein
MRQRPFNPNAIGISGQASGRESGLGRGATDEKSAAGLFLVGEGLAVGADLDFGLFAGGEDLGLVGYDCAMLCD